MKRLSLAAAWVVGWAVHLRRIVWFWKAAFVRPAVLTGNASREKCVFGVVLSGGDFTPGGAYPDNYGYPPNASIDYYASKGMGIVRLPFLWERVQPVKNGPLDATEMSRIDPVVDYAISRGLKVGIDVHNGGYGYGALIGGPYTSDADFADLWGKLATHYKDKPDVLFMLMSEPSAQSARQWLRSANAAIAAIRATGATQTIVVPGSYFDGAWTWTVTDNADVVGCGVVDPLEQLHVRGPPVSRQGRQRRKLRHRLANHRRGQAGGSYGVGTRPRQEVLPGRVRHGGGCSEPRCPGHHAGLHPAQRRRLGVCDVVGRRGQVV